MGTLMVYFAWEQVQFFQAGVLSKLVGDGWIGNYSNRDTYSCSYTEKRLDKQNSENFRNRFFNFVFFNRRAFNFYQHRYRAKLPPRYSYKTFFQRIKGQNKYPAYQHHLVE